MVVDGVALKPQAQRLPGTAVVPPRPLDIALHAPGPDADLVDGQLRQAATGPAPDKAPANDAIDAGDIASTAPPESDEEANGTRAPERIATGSKPPSAGTTPAQRADASPAAITGTTPTVATTGATATAPELDPADTELQRLQAESAQLEALLAWSGTPAEERPGLEAALAATEQQVAAERLAPNQRRGHVSWLDRLKHLVGR